MVGLLDVAKVSHEVIVRGKPLAVYGVSAAGVASLLDRYSEVRALFSGRADLVSPEKIQQLAPEVVAAIIAAGCGSPGDKEAEAVAASLSIAEQVTLLSEIITLTFPKGVGPFVQEFTALLGVLNVPGVGGEPGKEADTK